MIAQIKKEKGKICREIFYGSGYLPACVLKNIPNLSYPIFLMQKTKDSPQV